jgi:hypothetical protein
MGDQFLKDGQLEPDALKEAAKENGRDEQEVQVRMQEGYDHSYYFVSDISALALWCSRRVVRCELKRLGSRAEGIIRRGCTAGQCSTG